ncbi:methyltransferase [Planktothrix sp. FACHB-1355]|uniref:Methyltransferase n=1 Tax=Aerosakkonema funiforme FACHB-1375 TaxID=2949571 RepID=A0A926ZGM0_9CYAN|nr:MULTISPECIES: methyltransferase [Oscillatoriales]MBD2182378.1 methyltransferase [Aerosakkonema funiforme FACHB-1375]MBD3561059.1 methyltransferase [Planktothrix sp. FACHB-1355]
MSQQTCVNIQKPKTDEGLLWNILLAGQAHRVLLVAHNLKLFSVLAEKPLSFGEICDKLKIASRPAFAILSVLTSIGLIDVTEDSYCLTLLAREYLLENSHTYFGGFLDLMIVNDELVSSFDSLKQAVLTNSQQLAENRQFKSFEEQVAAARNFTYGMHGHSMGAALAWPELLNLSEYKQLLDIAGGSGAHSIGVVLKWPQLQATVFDLQPVCEVAQEFVTRYGLQSQVRTFVGDMWKDSFPPADLHFYSDIYHDWSPEQGQFLTQKSFESLLPGGRIIIHEMLYDDSKKGPFTVAAYNVGMLVGMQGQQYSGAELSAMLAEVGFTEIEVKPSTGYWSIVTGCKPK